MNVNRPAMVAAALVAAVGVLAAARLLRRPEAWAGLHLDDGMLVILEPDDPQMPALRAGAGDVIRALRWDEPAAKGG